MRSVPLPVRVTARLDSRLSRWLWLVKWLLVVPHLLVLALLWLAFGVLSLLALAAILINGRYPRAIFEFNMLADEWVLEPVARGYRYVAPQPVRRSVSNFLANLRSPAPMRELAAWLACDASNVTGIVDGLERRGLVTRRPDPADRRVKHLVLTPEGERRRQLLRTHNHERASALFALPVDDLQRLRDLLARLVRDRLPGRCEGNPAAPTP